MFGWVVTPDSGVHRNSIFIGGTRFSNFAVGKYAVASVKPAIWPPVEGVESFVSVLVSESIEKDLRLGVRDVVAVCIGDEHKVGCGADPYTAEAYFESTDKVKAFDELFSRVEDPVLVGVFKDDDLIEALAFGGSFGVGVGFCDPETTFMVEGHCDGLVDFGFTCSELDVEAFGNRHVVSCFCAGEVFLEFSSRFWLSGLVSDAGEFFGLVF